MNKQVELKHAGPWMVTLASGPVAVLRTISDCSVRTSVESLYICTIESGH